MYFHISLLLQDIETCPSLLNNEDKATASPCKSAGKDAVPHRRDYAHPTACCGDSRQPKSEQSAEITASGSVHSNIVRAKR